MDDRFCFAEGDQVLPLISEEICTGCGECVEACPVGAMALVEGKAAIVRPELCSYCGDCEELCPKGAIARPFEVVLQEAVRHD
ncbi:MAG TPA: 4Fe-4S dicluster domain-containing protein [Anaerolineae bacterium]|nr:4Fe-4S dicluster domain-containing protein [Anaerolineae bacterium]